MVVSGGRGASLDRPLSLLTDSYRWDTLMESTVLELSHNIHLEAKKPSLPGSVRLDSASAVLFVWWVFSPLVRVGRMVRNFWRRGSLEGFFRFPRVVVGPFFRLFWSLNFWRGFFLALCLSLPFGGSAYGGEGRGAREKAEPSHRGRRADWRKALSKFFRQKKLNVSDFLKKLGRLVESRKGGGVEKGGERSFRRRGKAGSFGVQRRRGKGSGRSSDELAGEYRRPLDKRMVLSKLKVLRREPIFRVRGRRPVKLPAGGRAKKLEIYRIAVYKVRFRLMGVVKIRLGEIAVVGGEKFDYNCSLPRYCRELKNIVKDFFSRRGKPPYNRLLKGGDTGWKLYKFLLYSNSYSPQLMRNSPSKK